MAAQDYFWLGLSVLVLLAFGASYVQKQLKLRRAHDWPIQSGRVDSATIRLESRGDKQSAYVAEVRYAYAMNGAAYSGRLRRSFMREKSAQQWIANYPPGRILTIRYNPGNFADSVLLEREQIGVHAA
jgi:hypothetical protein